jgi:hypothetical protein
VVQPGRRLARDYEHHPTASENVIRWVAITTMIHRLAGCRPRHHAPGLQPAVFRPKPVVTASGCWAGVNVVLWRGGSTSYWVRAGARSRKR